MCVYHSVCGYENHVRKIAVFQHEQFIKDFLFLFFGNALLFSVFHSSLHPCFLTGGFAVGTYNEDEYISLFIDVGNGHIVCFDKWVESGSLPV